MSRRGLCFDTLLRNYSTTKSLAERGALSLTHTYRLRID